MHRECANQGEEKVKNECLYRFIVNMLKEEGNFVIKVFPVLVNGLRSARCARCKLEVHFVLKGNIVGV